MTRIKPTQEITAWVLAVMTIPIHFAIKFIPVSKFDFTKNIDLENEVDDNPLLRL